METQYIDLCGSDKKIVKMLETMRPKDVADFYRSGIVTREEVRQAYQNGYDTIFGTTQEDNDQNKNSQG